MKFPDDFPEHAQAAVIAERIKAAAALAEAGKHNGADHDEAGKKYVLRAFAAFAHEACELGRAKIWTVTRIESEVIDFLFDRAKAARVECYELGVEIRSLIVYEHLPLGVMLFRKRPREVFMRADVMREFKASPEWAHYQIELLEVANTQAKPAESALIPPVASERRGYRKEIEEWMKRKQIHKLADAAQRLGVSETTLKSIMTTKGEARYGPETLERVLKAIGTADSAGE